MAFSIALLEAAGRARRVRGDRIPGGRADRKTDSEFSPTQLRAGSRVEREHTSSPTLAREIAKDHLTESPSYYTHLRRMERSMEKKAVWAAVYAACTEELGTPSC